MEVIVFKGEGDEQEISFGGGGDIVEGEKIVDKLVVGCYDKCFLLQVGSFCNEKDVDWCCVELIFKGYQVCI